MLSLSMMLANLTKAQTGSNLNKTVETETTKHRAACKQAGYKRHQALKAVVVNGEAFKLDVL
jgi:hypothetical protein